MELRSIRVVVEARNVALPEYQVTSQEDAIVCFVPSKAGANFQVTVYNASGVPVEFRVYLDGAFAQNFLAHSRKHATMKGIQVNRETMRPFEFTVLKLTDDETALSPSHVDLEALGTIRVDIFRVDYRGTKPENYRVDNYDSLDDQAAVHEKTKKAGCHRVQLGKPIPATVRTAQVVHLDSVNGQPYARFTFRYRPTEMLQAQGITSESPQPNTSQKRPAAQGPQRSSPKRPRTQRVHSSPRVHAGAVVDDAVRPKEESQDLEALLAQRAALESQIRAVQAINRVKREPSPISHGATHKVVIDLTEDSD